MIGHLPINALVDSALDLIVGDATLFRVAVDDDPHPLPRVIQAAQVVEVMHQVPQRWDLGCADQVELIGVYDHGHVRFIQAGRTIDQDALVPASEKFERVPDRLSRNLATRRVKPVRGLQDVQAARMWDKKGLEEIRVQPVGILYEGVEVITMPLQGEVKGGVAQLRMVVDEEGLPLVDLRQQRAHIRRHGRNSGAALDAQKAEDLPSDMLSLFISLFPDSSQGLDQLVAINRFEEVFGAPALHRADDQKGIGV